MFLECVLGILWVFNPPSVALWVFFRSASQSHRSDKSFGCRGPCVVLRRFCACQACERIVVAFSFCGEVLESKPLRDQISVSWCLGE